MSTIDTAELTSLPRTYRPRELLLDAHHVLLRTRLQLLAAANGANAFGAQPRVRSAVEAVDRLRDELLALAFEADIWRRNQEAAQLERRRVKAMRFRVVDGNLVAVPPGEPDAGTVGLDEAIRLTGWTAEAARSLYRVAAGEPTTPSRA